MNADNNLSTKANFSFKACLYLYTGLVVVLLTKTWFFTPEASYRLKLIVSAVQLVPLLLPLPGLLLMKPRSSSWLCFILCFYFISGVMQTWAQPEMITGWLLTGLCSGLFVSAMMFTRWQSLLMKYS